jgi:hypothetical protein
MRGYKYIRHPQINVDTILIQEFKIIYIWEICIF